MKVFSWFGCVNRGVAGLVVVYFCVGVVGVAGAQSQEEVDAQTAKIMEQVQALAEQLPTLQSIEEEQDALMRKLGQTHDALEAERRRSERLAAELAALGAGSPIAGGVAGADSVVDREAEERTAWLSIPRRRVNALGLLETGWEAAGVVPTGTQVLVPRWPVHVALPAGVVFPEVVFEGGQTRLVLPGTLGGQRVVAEISVEGERVRWAWRGVGKHQGGPHGQGGGAEASDARLDAVLARTVFEAQRDGVVLGELRPEPSVKRLPASARASEGVSLSVLEALGLDVSLAPVRLVAGRTPAGWRLAESGADRLVWVSVGRSLSVRWRLEGARLLVDVGPGVEGRLAGLERQRRAWARDLPAGASAVGGEGLEGDAGLAAAEIARLDAEASRLGALREALLAERASVAAGGGVGAAGLGLLPTAGLVDAESGLVLVRLVWSAEGFE